LAQIRHFLKLARRVQSYQQRRNAAHEMPRRTPMTNLTSKLAAVLCTVLLSTTMIVAAVGPAQAGATGTVVSTVRVA
jgi:hypothetical protein